jgi:YjbR
VTADDFREIALGLEGVVERAHMGHPDFRANGRILASLSGNEEVGVVKLTPAEQKEFLRSHARAFEPASGAWGRQGWTQIRLDAADRATARSALVLAWQNIHQKPPARPRKRRSRSR